MYEVTGLFAVEPCRTRTGVIMRTISRLAAITAATVIVVGGTAGASAQSVDPVSAALGSVGPTGSAVGLPAIPGDVAPAPNRLVAVGGSPTWTCFGSVTADIDNAYGPGTVFVDWKLHNLGVGTCGLEATLSWRNLDTGATGAHRLVQNLPGNWPSHGDDQNNTSVTGPGPVEYRLVTNGGGYSAPLVLATP